MKFKIALKFKDGLIYTTQDMDAYEIHGDGDMFRLMIKGKLDSQKIIIDNKELNYKDLSSFEVIFNE